VKSVQKNSFAQIETWVAVDAGLFEVSEFSPSTFLLLRRKKFALHFFSKKNRETISIGRCQIW
jgi:hypothetical protein